MGIFVMRDFKVHSVVLAGIGYCNPIWSFGRPGYRDKLCTVYGKILCLTNRYFEPYKVIFSIVS